MRLQNGVYIDDTTTAYRINQSIPYKFVVWKDDNVAPTLYRAESNIEGVDDVSNAVADVVLQAALDAGGASFVKAGTYPITTNLLPTVDVGLVGEGDTTVLQMDGALVGSIIYSTASIEMYLEHMCLDGNSVGATNYGVEFRDGALYARHLLLKDIRGSGFAITPQAGDTITYLTVDSCRFSNIGNSGTNLGPGIRIDQGGGIVSHAALSNNYFINGQEHAIKVYASSADFASITNNYIKTMDQSGITLMSPGQIIGNHVDTSTSYKGIIAQDNTRVIGNYVTGAAADGIYVEGDDIIVADNYVYNITGQGIVVYTNSDNVVVTGNRVDTTSGSGITLTTVTHCNISNNIITGSTTRDIYLTNSTYNTIANNDLTAAIAIGEYGTSDYNLITGNLWTGATNMIFTGPSLNTRVEGNFGYNLTGKVTNPFKDASNSISTKQGDAASPTASTDYTVYNGDIVISSTDSGSADCAIQIDGPDANAIFAAAQSTLLFQTVPIGFTINWGAYTGAAPTVVVCYS